MRNQMLLCSDCSLRNIVKHLLSDIVVWPAKCCVRLACMAAEPANSPG